MPKPTAIGVIPARYGSTRFPGKPLAQIAGKTLIARVYERAAAASSLSEVIVATDDERIREHCRGAGMQVAMTSAAHPSGTDRIGEVAQSHAADAYVNIQGDEPLIPPEALNALVERAQAAIAPMATLVSPLEAGGEALHDPNVVKAAVAASGYALYFSRAPIPYPRRPEHARHYRHIGVYYFTADALRTFIALPPSPLELAESLEQLRALEHGIPILAVEFPYTPIAVDVPEDIARVEAALCAPGGPA